MTLHFDPAIEQRVLSQLHAGNFRDADQVMAEALTLLELQIEIRQRQHASLRQQIEAGAVAAARGEWMDETEARAYLATARQTANHE